MLNNLKGVLRFGSAKDMRVSGKAAIITIVSVENIGNRLQNYAVQELLKEYKLSVTTIDNYNVNNGSLTEIIKADLFSFLLKIGFFETKIYIDVIKRNPRLRLVRDFNRKYISITHKYLFKTKSSERMKKYADDFDYYCIGSDQIWNSGLVQNNDYFFCCFTESEKCFSFSASMGNTYVAPEYIENYKKGLMHVGNISVREAGAKKHIESLVNREAIVLMDPTLILERQKWIEIINKPDIMIQGKYLVTYFLSEITKAQKDFINEYAKKHNCQIIEMNGQYRDQTGPSEFVYLIKSAEYIFTDSFHGTAFSVVFNRPFLCFQRNNIYDMSDRICTLLEKLDLKNRFYKGDNSDLAGISDYIDDLPRYNVDDILRAERNKAKLFLDKCIYGNE